MSMLCAAPLELMAGLALLKLSFALWIHPCGPCFALLVFISRESTREGSLLLCPSCKKVLRSRSGGHGRCVVLRLLMLETSRYVAFIVHLRLYGRPLTAVP